MDRIRLRCEDQLNSLPGLRYYIFQTLNRSTFKVNIAILDLIMRTELPDLADQSMTRFAKLARSQTEAICLITV